MIYSMCLLSQMCAQNYEKYLFFSIECWSDTLFFSKNVIFFEILFVF